MAILQNQTFRNVINPETGELETLEESKTFRIKLNSEPFYYVYMEHILQLFQITRDSEKKLLNYMLCNMVYNTNEVTLDRKLAANDTKLNQASITRSLKTLKERGVLSLKDNSRLTYLVNPALFWKGDAKTRNSLLKEVQLEFKLILD